MGLEPISIEATTLPDAWFVCVDSIFEYGRQWTVQQGSYEGQKRWELDHVTVHIKHPGARPLIPEMPSYLDHIPPPTTMEYVSDYITYLMTDMAPKKNETYTYGERIAGEYLETVIRGVLETCKGSQIQTVIDRFKRNHGTNQCSMSVAKPADIHLSDPPCLREIDCRIIAPDGLHEGEEPALHFIVYFRSWDLWGGFSANLAAIRLMQEYMAKEIGVEAGEIIAASKGLHLYDHTWDIAKLRTAR